MGDLELLYDSKFEDFKGKFTTHWLGSYDIGTIFDNGYIRLKTIDLEETSFLVNAHRLKLYWKLESKIEFLHSLLKQKDFRGSR